MPNPDKAFPLKIKKPTSIHPTKVMESRFVLIFVVLEG